MPMYRRRAGSPKWDLVDQGVNFCLLPAIAVADRERLPEPTTYHGSPLYKLPVFPRMTVAVAYGRSDHPSLMDVGYRFYRLKQYTFSWVAIEKGWDYSFDPPRRVQERSEYAVRSSDWVLESPVRLVR